jgi:hypothetical protein
VEVSGFRGDVYGENDSVSLPADGLANADTEWHLYVLTYDGAVATLWLDGIAVESAPFTGRVARNVDRAVQIGGDPWGASFDGQIDEIRIYDKALSGTEIAALYALP